MMIKDIPINERPRERLIKYGKENISNEELLSIILKTGTKNISVKELSLNLMNDVKDITELKNYTMNRLLSIKGIGIAKASEVISMIELGKRIYLNEPSIRIKCTNPYDIYKSMKYLFDNNKQECFYCIYLNNKSEVIERKLLFMGTINKSIVHPREIFKYAYLSSAYSIICVHNHPSGDINPSKEDIRFTKALIDIGNIQNIPLVDHIIIGSDNYYSFRDNLDIFNM